MPPPYAPPPIRPPIFYETYASNIALEKGL